MATTKYNSELSMCGGKAPDPAAPSAPKSLKVPVELHVCMGLNACKGHDRTGANNCAGTGYCATAEQHNCQTLNNCRNQGGCGLYGDAEQQMNPGNNNCAWQGSCAVPIQAERFSTLGDNQGLSTWKRARVIFEKRMTDANRNFGPAPFECGPPQAWLTSVLGSYDSCGNSGNKSCSFGFNNPANNAKKLCEGGKE
ncbi:hypothetical protein HYN48_08860 [Flavobacterium magnum]|uniref:Uncharacterized protein n=1 Tax=Flavobacterium magnum TaxID=2162713 RepID=A0A2S0REJ4_9FLAO|nr:hypothetical protein [Flavobacterium magnum]AWA30183.1 hypothetical protein HYN48_08860 [Flavobacterium magnum]